MSYMSRIIVFYICCWALLSEGFELGPDYEWHGQSSCPEDAKNREPTIPLETFPTCQQYQSLSCCELNTVQKIEKSVNGLMRTECPSCYQLVQEWKCAECHPKAGHFFIGKHASIRFCKDYCHLIFETCKDIPFDYFGKAFYLNEPKTLTADQFCEAMTAEEGFCFRGTMEKLPVDKKCKCADHQCHLAQFNKGVATGDKAKGRKKKWDSKGPAEDANTNLKDEL